MASGSSSQKDPNGKLLIQYMTWFDETTFKLQNKKETSSVQWSSFLGYSVDDSQPVAQNKKVSPP